MAYYDERLRELAGQVTRKNRLEAQLRELYSQRQSLREHTAELQKSSFDEQADVDRLEGGSLASFFYSVVGKKDEKLDKERAEARAARVKYDAAAKALSATEEDIRRFETEMADLRGCEAAYAQALQEKAEAVKMSGSPDKQKIWNAETRIALLENRRKETDEAIAAGETALNTAEEILSDLDSAKDWGVWDLLGGGMIAAAVKHDRLDEAQERVEELQENLRRFKTELADVTIDADMKVNADGFTRFADWFFDGLFVDWMVLDEIHRSQTRVEQVTEQIRKVLRSLADLNEQTAKDHAEACHLRDEAILSAG